MSMRLDFFVKLKKLSSSIILFVGIKYSLCDLFLTSISMPDLQSSDMRRIRLMMSALPLGSARLNVQAVNSIPKQSRPIRLD